MTTSDDITIEQIMKADNGVMVRFVREHLDRIDREVRDLRQACALAELMPAAFNHKLAAVTEVIDDARALASSN